MTNMMGGMGWLIGTGLAAARASRRPREIPIFKFSNDKFDLSPG
jgi:hypothetical protein